MKSRLWQEAREGGERLIPQAVVVCNGKGGVGKTSLVANLAVEAARRGRRVLAVDLDVQGNLGLDLGYTYGESGDDGAGLSRAVQFGDRLVPLRSVRDDVDVVAGGAHTQTLVELLQRLGPADASRALLRVLAPISRDYGLVMVDAPPGASTLVEAVLSISRGLVVPTKCDGASLDGLTLIGRQYQRVRAAGNRRLSLLGVVLFDVNRRASALLDQIWAELEAALGESPPVFEASIRHSQRAAYDMRAEGLVACEYAVAAQADRAERLATLRADPDRLKAAPPARSSAAAGLADDYRRLAHEVLTRLDGLPL